MGLISDLVPSAKLTSAAIEVVRFEQRTQQFQRDREAWAKPLEISDTELGFLGATASALIQGQTGGQYPAPQAALLPTFMALRRLESVPWLVRMSTHPTAREWVPRELAARLDGLRRYLDDGSLDATPTA